MLIAAFATIFSARANAQVIRVESQNRIIVSTEEGDAKEPGDFNPRISIYARKAIKGPFTGTAFFTVAQGTGNPFDAPETRGYAVGYTGIAYAPIPEVEIEQSIGIETFSVAPRLESSLFFAVGKLTGIGILEYGTQTREDWWQNRWFTTRLVYQVHPKVSIAAMWQRFDGYGPRIDIAGSHGFNLWVAGLYDRDTGRYNMLFAIRRFF